MRISMVVAASTNDVIGRDGELPWRISEDLRYFKAVTMGHPVVMGRRTFESIGRPLPGRLNIVLTTQEDYRAEGCRIVGSPAAALAAAGEADEVMIIGGGEIYALFLPVATRIFMTRVDVEVQGDAYFPALDADQWKLTDEQRCDGSDADQPSFCFQTFERVAAPVSDAANRRL